LRVRVIVVSWHFGQRNVTLPAVFARLFPSEDVAMIITYMMRNAKGFLNISWNLEEIHETEKTRFLLFRESSSSFHEI
jgi:hypothetical protein